MKFSRKKNSEPVYVLDGLELSEEVFLKNENRIFTLLLKGLIVYCVAAGLIGCALTSTGSDFSHLIFNLAVVIYSIIISFIYYNKKTENIGDLIYIILIIVIGLRFGRVINSGFYSWMNDIIGSASVYFDLPEIGGYVVAYYSNLTASLTFAACYLGAIVAIIINLSIVKKMHFGDLILDVILVLFLPAYFELEPDGYYISILVIGIVLSAVWCMTGRYEKIDNSKAYIKNKKYLTYTYNVRAHLYSFIQLSICCIVILLTIFVVLPKDDYKLIRTSSDLKKTTDEYAQIFITSGIYGFFNQYENNGGISSGRLGGVASVSLDYETDIEVTYVPYSMSPVYLRNFIASDYIPYENRWKIADENYINNDEYVHLNDLYNTGAPYSGKYKLIINNIAGEYGEYYSYYSANHAGLKRGQTYEEICYPRFSNSFTYGINLGMSEDERRYWLSIPNDNRPTIINAVELMGITDEMDVYEIANTIKEYYYNNIPYTLRPEATPWNKDFINYFLGKNKKGYCVHFASAATLIFRQCGIPARYVEGYAFDYNDILSAKAAENVDSADMSDGYSEMDSNIAVTVNVLDANAHAWVEVYTDEYGWIPVELTPPSSDINMEKESFFERFMNLFGNVKNIDSIESENATEQKYDNSKIRGFMIAILSVIVVVPLFYLLYRLISIIYAYTVADINTKLVYRYRLFLRKKRRKCPELSDAHNYRDALYFVYKNSDNDELNKAIIILEKAGFSDKMISKEEFDFVCRFLKR